MIVTRLCAVYTLILFSISSTLVHPQAPQTEPEPQEVCAQATDIADETLLDQARTEFCQFLTPFKKLIKNSLDYASTQPDIDLFESLQRRCKRIEKDLDHLENVDGIVVLIDELIETLLAVSNVPGATAQDNPGYQVALDKLYEAYFYFDAAYDDALMHSTTHAQLAKRIALRTVGQVVFNVMYAKIAEQLDPKHRDGQGNPITFTPDSFKAALMHDLPYTGLLTFKFLQNMAIDEFYPAINVPTQTRWVELITQLVLGYYGARFFLKSSRHMAGSSFFASWAEIDEVMIHHVLTDIIKTLIRTDFYIADKKSPLHKAAVCIRYASLLAYPMMKNYTKYTALAFADLISDPHKFSAEIAPLLQSDVATALRESTKGLIPAAIDLGISWPPYLRRKNRKRNLTAISGMIIGTIIKAALSKKKPAVL